MEKIEIGVVREGVRIREIKAPLRRSDGDPEALVFVDVLCPDRAEEAMAAGRTLSAAGVDVALAE